jgi:hypothetical protein
MATFLFLNIFSNQSSYNLKIKIMKIKHLLFSVVIFGFSGLLHLGIAQDKSEIEIFQLSAEPTIDGELDAVWDAMPVHTVNQLEAGGTRAGNADYDVSFRTGWKNNKLFFFFDIKDDVHIFNSALRQWRQDYFVIFMNFSETHETDVSYGDDIPAWWFRTTIPTTGEEALGGGIGPTGEVGLVDFPAHDIEYKLVEGGYIVEIMFDLSDAEWEITKGELAEGFTFGFDIEAGDVDETTGTSGANSDRKYQLFWSETGNDNNWQNLSGLGIAIIKDEILGGGDPSSVNEAALKNVRMYPNPARDVLMFENLSQVERIKIVSLTGQTIRDLNARDASFLDISGITKGIYLVVFEGVNSKSAQKLVIK